MVAFYEHSDGMMDDGSRWRSKVELETGVVLVVKEACDDLQDMMIPPDNMVTEVLYDGR